MSDKRIIKKYPNRRLYDTERGEYITLADIKALVLDRVEFVVVDSKTQKDLTQSTLLQIISEEENTSQPIFTTPILQDLIRSYNEKSQDIFRQYLEQSLSLLSKQSDFLQSQWLSFQNMLLKNPGKKPEDK